MINFTYENRPAVFFSDPNGRIKQKDKKIAKFVRVGKIARDWGTIEPKIIKDIEAGSKEGYGYLLMAETGIGQMHLFLDQIYLL